MTEQQLQSYTFDRYAFGDGPTRVGPAKLYGTLVSALLSRAESQAQHEKHLATGAQQREWAIEALHAAASALDVDDPMRSQILDLIRKFGRSAPPVQLSNPAAGL